MADNNTPPRPVYKDFAPDINSGKYPKKPNGSLTQPGRAIFDRDEQDAKQTFQRETQAWDRLYSKKTEASGEAEAGRINYQNSDAHRWYSDWGGLPSFGAGFAGGYGLARLAGPAAYAGISPLGRLRVAVPYLGELGAEYGGERLGDYLARDENLTPHAQDINRAGSNFMLGALPGTFSGALYKVFGEGGPNPNSTAMVTGPTAEAVQGALPPSAPAPISANGQKLIAGARLLPGGEDIADPIAAKAHIEDSLAQGRVSPALKTELRKVLEMTAPQHTYANALSKLTPSLGGLIATAVGAQFGADLASNKARAAGLEGTLGEDVAPYAGGAAGAGAGYGAYRGLSSGLNALAEASPIAGRFLRAVPVAGEGLMAYDALSGIQRGLERRPTEEELMAEAQRRELGKRLYDEQQLQEERGRMARSAQGAAWRDPEMRQAIMQRGVSPNALASYGLMAQGEPVQNELAMNGPNAAFLKLVQDFADHYGTQR